MFKVRVIPILKFKGRVNRHKWWLIKETTGKILGNYESMSEAIRKVEDEGWILEPDYQVK